MKSTNHIDIIAIGASAGGPDALQILLSELPLNFPLPILVVQHIAHGFIHNLADWFNQTATVQARIAKDGERMLPGSAYFAPDRCQMGVGRGGKIELRDERPENGHRPAVSYLFRPVNEIFGRNAVGILLSGMGKDGAKELRQMREKGAVTIAQDRKSSVVFGMPKAAVELKAASYALPPKEIARFLSSLSNGRKANIKQMEACIENG